MYADNDGIPDIIEATGMRTQSGQTIQTDPNNPDCDGDGSRGQGREVQRYGLVSDRG